MDFRPESRDAPTGRDITRYVINLRILNERLAPYLAIWSADHMLGKKGRFIDIEPLLADGGPFEPPALKEALALGLENQLSMYLDEGVPLEDIVA